MLTAIFETFIILFVVIDPIGLAPMFAALTHGDSEAYKRRMALKGTAWRRWCCSYLCWPAAGC